MQDVTGIVHLTNDYKTTLCEAHTLEEVEDRWTDSLGEVLEEIERHPAQGWTESIAACGYCNRCVQVARVEVDLDREWQREMQREIAREEGMLNGIDSYNDWMGY